MINAVHSILFARDADATRAFLTDVLELESVDAGGGWLIFALPPAELAVHPAEDAGRAALSGTSRRGLARRAGRSPPRRRRTGTARPRPGAGGGRRPRGGSA